MYAGSKFQVELLLLLPAITCITCCYISIPGAPTPALALFPLPCVLFYFIFSISKTKKSSPPPHKPPPCLLGPNLENPIFSR